ncbi:MAG: XTP/dITP diphosphatase [Anaerolineae bacterium]
MKLLIATRNPGKLREYKELLKDLPFEPTYLPEEGIDFEVQEAGQSFAENARLKASSYARASGLLTLADDSGLEVDALGGEPGVRSARYAGENAGDEERYWLLLKKLEGVSWERRTARFRCVLALATPEGEIYLTEGVREGMIAFGPRGEYGFGYDPVFYMPEYGRTMAELLPEEKNRLSHRAQAVEKMKEILKRFI